MKVIGAHCGIPGCEWAVRVPIADRLELSPGAVSECYGFFWSHCVAHHGLNPDTTELPGLAEAKFFIDLENGGGLTVCMRAV